MIELRHLRYFIAVAEELNFRRAAERVHIDQTPLSRTVRDLEEKLSVQLFVRSPRRLTLTPAGSELLAEAREVLLRIERARRSVRETDSGFHAPVRVGVADDIAQPKLSECLNQWRELAPATPVQLTEMPALEMADALRREVLDAGFSFGLPLDDTIEQVPVWSYPVVAVLPRGHELASEVLLPVAKVLAFPLLSYRADRLPGLRHQIHAFVRRHTTTPTFAGDVCTLGGYLTRIGAGMGVGLADSGHVAALGRPDVVVVPLQEAERVTTFVLHKHRRTGLSHALHRFIEHARSLNER